MSKFSWSCSHKPGLVMTVVDFHRMTSNSIGIFIQMNILEGFFVNLQDKLVLGVDKNRTYFLKLKFDIQE